MVERGRRLKWHPKKSDLLFVIGATAFLTEVFGPGLPERSIIIASLVLMGVPVVSRIGGNGNGKDKP